MDVRKFKKHFDDIEYLGQLIMDGYDSKRALGYTNFIIIFLTIVSIGLFALVFDLFQNPINNTDYTVSVCVCILGIVFSLFVLMREIKNKLEIMRKLKGYHKEIMTLNIKHKMNK